MIQKCTTPNCPNTVKRAGYKLCYDCWKKQNPPTSTKKNKEPDAKYEKSSDMITVTAIGEAVGLKPRRINNILSELGWIERGKKGWLVKEVAANLFGAVQKENYITGTPYVLWSKKILGNSVFLPRL